MITTSDVANIIYRDCKVFGMDIIPSGEKLTGIPTKDVILIHPKEQTSEKIWKKSFVEVNFLVPDLQTDTADSIHLQEVERKALRQFESVCGEWDGTRYIYSVYSSSIESDTEKKCHFANVKLLFEVLNVRL